MKTERLRIILKNLIYINLAGTIFPLYTIFIGEPASVLRFIFPVNNIPLWASALFWLYLTILFFPIIAITISVIKKNKKIISYRSVNIVSSAVIFISWFVWIFIIMVINHL